MKKMTKMIMNAMNNMIIENHNNPEIYEHHYICYYHKKHPFDRNYAGCGCSSSFVLKEEEPEICKNCDPINPNCNRCIGS